jgi:hypothetical protein
MRTLCARGHQTRFALPTSYRSFTFSVDARCYLRIIGHTLGGKCYPVVTPMSRIAHPSRNTRKPVHLPLRIKAARDYVPARAFGPTYIAAGRFPIAPATRREQWVCTNYSGARQSQKIVCAQKRTGLVLRSGSCRAERRALPRTRAVISTNLRCLACQHCRPRFQLNAPFTGRAPELRRLPTYPTT